MAPHTAPAPPPASCRLWYALHPVTIGGEGELVAGHLAGFIEIARAKRDRLAALPCVVDLEGRAPDIVGRAAAVLVQPHGVTEAR